MVFDCLGNAFGIGGGIVAAEHAEGGEFLECVTEICDVRCDYRAFEIECHLENAALACLPVGET